MQIRIIIEHKYSYSHQKQICSYVKKEKEEVFISIFTNQERNTKISKKKKNPSQIEGYR